RLVHYNYFHDDAPECIRCFASAPEIFNNTFNDTIYWSCSIWMDSSDCFIHDNLFTGNYGIGSSYSSSPVIINNIFYGCYGISTLDGLPSVFNNTFYECGGGIRIYSESLYSVMNNIIAQCLDFGVENYWYATPPETLNIKYNNVWGNLGGDFVGCPDYLGVPVMVNANGDSCDIFFNISEDPLFIGGEPFDFNLSLGSPCIDAGVAVGLPFNGLAPDIGALESNYTGVRDLTAATPGEFYLGQNYPNPFNECTVITYGLPRGTQVELKVYNILGALVEVLVEGMVEAGDHRIVWNPVGLSSGMYFLRLDCPEEDFTRLRAVILLK
nr:right-handed parallel beta-helix repeat-containing protein [FCB group bacterium]